MLPYFEFSLELLRHHSCWVNLKENRQRVSDPNHIHPAIYIPKWNREVINKQFLYAPIKLQRIMNLPYEVSYWQLYVPQTSFQYICKSSGLTVRMASTEFQYLQTPKLTIKAHQWITCTWINNLACNKTQAMETEASGAWSWSEISGYNSTTASDSRLAIAGCWTPEDTIIDNIQHSMGIYPQNRIGTRFHPWTIHPHSKWSDPRYYQTCPLT